NQVGFLDVAVLDQDALLAALDLAEAHDAVDGRNHGRGLGPAGFEQFGHAGQTARDVAGLARGARDFDKGLAGGNGIAVLELQVGVLGNRVPAQLGGAVLAHDDDVRMQLGALVADDAEALHAGGIVVLGHVGDAVLEAVELDHARAAGDDQGVVRIPFEHQGAGLDLGAILDLEQGAVGHHVADLGYAVLVDQGHFAGAADHHVLALPVGDRFHVAEHDLAIPLGLLDRFGG